MPRAKPVLFFACLSPLAWLAWSAAAGLGANPIEAVTRSLGDWALRLLLVTLAVTPLRLITGWSAVIRMRRMLGLFSFFYTALHLASYLVLDQFFYWPEIVADILKRPYITIGMAAFIVLLLLAVTSPFSVQRRLGGRRWQRLHRLVYGAAVAAVLHYWWLIKADTREPLIYALILAMLLAVRVRWFRDFVHLFKPPLRRHIRE